MIRPPMPLVYAWRNVLARKASTAATTASVAAAAMVYVVMAATAEGINQIAASTGSEANLLVFSQGANSAELSRLDRNTLNRALDLPELARTPTGNAIASEELVLPSSIRREGAASSGARYVTVRGVTPRALEVHDEVGLLSGRYPREGNEVLVGHALSGSLGGVGVGDELWIGSDRYTVSGVLDANGQVFDGEAWVDLDELQGQTGRREASMLVLKLREVSSAGRAAKTLEGRADLKVSVRPERDYYRDIQAVSLPFAYLGNLIGLILGVGAVMAGMNAMYGAMSRRIREFGTLRALGFSRWYVGGTVLLESVLVGMLGGGFGAALATSFNGFALNLMGLSFSLVVRGRSVFWGVALAVSIGALGGFLPARAALRIRITESLRQA